MAPSPIRQARSHLRSFIECKGPALVRRLGANRIGLWILQVAHRHLTPAGRSWFHEHFAKAFRDVDSTGFPAQRWECAFAGKFVGIPLCPGGYWLDWDTAVSITGHDIELKETYKALLNSEDFRPDLFLDIGGNYGTHSLLFLVHGIDTTTFEPNRSCLSYFTSLCLENSVSPRIESVALGETSGRITLTYPERETWLGSVQSSVVERLSNRSGLVREEVEIRTLDSFTSNLSASRILIKIDTEGNEMSVLNGAFETLRKFRPIVLFEVLTYLERDRIANFLEDLDYQVAGLPWRPPELPVLLKKSEFLSAHGTNFVAIPRASVPHCDSLG